jgi:uncharacterized sporulation protein YeaH/YhbH (DUF444 family)
MRYNRTRNIDIQRYIDRTKKVIQRELEKTLSKEDILDVDPGKKVKIKIPYVDEPYFKFYESGSGGGGGGSGGGSGDNGGSSEHSIELELTLDEMADLLFEYLGLPNLKNKGEDEVKEKFRVLGITKSGPKSRIHRRKTFYEMLKQKRIDHDVFRYRDVRKTEEPIFSAVIYLARDYSGSMTEEKKFRVRSASFWILNLLRRLYPKIEIKFLVHDTSAKFCDEHYFFYSSEGGGTTCSSAFELVENDIQKYDIDNNNFYIFYFSDGENDPSDNSKLIEKIVKLSSIVNMIVYGEVLDKTNTYGYYYQGTLLKLLEPLARNYDNIYAKKLINVRSFLMDIFYNEEEK